MINKIQFKKNTRFDLICLGRAGVDLYANQIGADLSDVVSFNKYLGGSSANIAFGTARLGLKSSMLTRVGDEDMGQFLIDSLQSQGCDVSHVVKDQNRLTALVILGIKDKERFPLLFYRENCADMAVSIDDFDENYIASSKALLITGTHFSTENTHKTSTRALEYAKKNGVKTILDIDFRPTLWGLTAKGDGETRYIHSDNVTKHLQSILSSFDLIVGTEEEISIAGGFDDTIKSLKAIRAISKAVIVLKLGALGCTIFTGSIPDTIDDGFIYYGIKVEVLNVLGAGDAFLSGFLKGWLNQEGYQQCCQYANIAGAFVVSRHACSPSMPSIAELEYFINNTDRIKEPEKDLTLNRLHKASVPKKKWNDLAIFAFDHRIQIAELFQSYKKGANEIKHIKNLFLDAFLEVAQSYSTVLDHGVLIDECFGHDALMRVTGQNYWIARPIELPLSVPIEFEFGQNLSHQIASWPKEHIVKCLIYYHPEQSEKVRLAQDKQIQYIYEVCNQFENEFLLEIIEPKELQKSSNSMAKTIEHIYNLGVFPDWWKLTQNTQEHWLEIEKIIKKHDAYCRGILMLGLDLPLIGFREAFQQIRSIELIKGFAIGRTIFKEPLEAWLKGQSDDNDLKQALIKRYKKLIDYWLER